MAFDRVSTGVDSRLPDEEFCERLRQPSARGTRLSPMKHIQIDDEAELASAFLEVAKPRSIPAELLSAPLEALEEKVLQGFKLGLMKRLVRRFTDNTALRLAAWRWLKPERQVSTHEHLVDLQRRVALGHMDHPVFCARLIESCRELMVRSPRLTRYLEARVAEVEFRLVAPLPGDEVTSRGFESLQAVLLAAQGARSADLAMVAARNALSQVGAIVKSALVGKDSPACAFDANLMLPVHAPPASSSSVGAARAQRLWSGFEAGSQAHQFFVVGIEAPKDPALYRGFWIPDVRRNNRPLPGAPRAFFFKSAQSVFVDDLPELPIDDEELRGRWRQYFQGGPGGFSGSLFISLPVVEFDHATPVAVVNVNIRDQRPWYRALSPSWLGRAAYLAAPWTTTAWHAFMLAWHLQDADTRVALPAPPLKRPAFLPVTALANVESVPKLPEGTPDA